MVLWTTSLTSMDTKGKVELAVLKSDGLSFARERGPTILRVMDDSQWEFACGADQKLFALQTTGVISQTERANLGCFIYFSNVSALLFPDQPRKNTHLFSPSTCFSLIYRRVAWCCRNRFWVHGARRSGRAR